MQCIFGQGWKQLKKDGRPDSLIAEAERWCIETTIESACSVPPYSSSVMWEPNEQLLLRAPTRYKKNEGTLYVTPRRVAWQQQGSAQLNPSISYVEIGCKWEERSLPWFTNVELLFSVSIGANTRNISKSTAQDHHRCSCSQRSHVPVYICESTDRERGDQVANHRTTRTHARLERICSPSVNSHVDTGFFSRTNTFSSALTYTDGIESCSSEWRRSKYRQSEELAARGVQCS